MSKTKLMVNGIPGKMALAVVHRVMLDERVSLFPLSLTSEKNKDKHYNVGPLSIKLLKPSEKDAEITKIKREKGLIAIDYTCPSATSSNASFYCNNNIPFVMGTTGFDLKLIAKNVLKSRICALVAPNMAKQIAALTNAIKHCADTFPEAFEGYTIAVTESHQKSKIDVSGTARELLQYFQRMGIKLVSGGITKIRDPEVQEKRIKVPKKYLNAHGWHKYQVISKDGTVFFELKHNINGREIYVEGTIDAAIFLKERIYEGCTGKIFSMMDVLTSTSSTNKNLKSSNQTN